MKNLIKKGIKISNGNKTIAAAIVFVLVQLFGDKIPFILNNQAIIDQVIEYSLEFGIGHKLFKAVLPFVKKQWHCAGKLFNRK